MNYLKTNYLKNDYQKLLSKNINFFFFVFSGDADSIQHSFAEFCFINGLQQLDVEFEPQKLFFLECLNCHIALQRDNTLFVCMKCNKRYTMTEAKGFAMRAKIIPKKNIVRENKRALAAAVKRALAAAAKRASAKRALAKSTKKAQAAASKRTKQRRGKKNYTDDEDYVDVDDDGQDDELTHRPITRSQTRRS